MATGGQVSEFSSSDEAFPEIPRRPLSQRGYYEEMKSGWERILAECEAEKAEVQRQLLLSPSDGRLEGRLKEIEGEIEKAVSLIKHCERRLRELDDGAEEKDRRKQESKRQFDEAMRDGYVSLETSTVLLMGPAGGGKSSLMDALVDKPPKKQRTSTMVRDKIRRVTNDLYQTTDNIWKEVSEQDMIELLAAAVQYLPRMTLNTLSSDLKAKLPTSTTSDMSSTPARDPTSKSPVQQAIASVIDLVLNAMTSSEQTGPKEPMAGKKLFGTKTKRVVDNGGQPQFQDVARLFIRHASAALLVSRLIDDLNGYPLDEFYAEGILVGTPCASHMSHGETLTSLLRSYLSHSPQDKKSLAVFVCTFLDQIKDPKVLEERNKAILDLLPPELKKQVVFSNRRLNRVIFALNAVSRDEDTKAVVQEIRKALEDAPSVDIEVPLWWFILELTLQKLCSLLGRGVLRKSECIKLAQCLGFPPASLEAALDYFNDTCIAHYYPEILPNTVFVDPQVPLDKVSELTKHAISLREATTPAHTTTATKTWWLFRMFKKAEKAPAAPVVAISPKWKRFRDEGIITLDMLSSPEFHKHYEDGLFVPADMIAIMMELLIIAPLSPVLGKIDGPLSEMEFLMPTLLRSIPPSELEEHRVFSPSAVPLLIRFLSGCIRCGVFCCLVVFLMKRCGWQVCLPSGEPVLLARNCVKLRIPNGPGTVTLIDSFTHIEVHIKARPKICQKVCPQIQSIILEGVDAASLALHYNNDKPVTSIFCPHPANTQEKRHYAEVYPDSGLWCCSKNPNLDGDLSLGHLVWFSDKSSPLDDVDHHRDTPQKVATAEYKVLTQCYPTLVLCIQQSPNSVADQLKPHGVLSPEDESYLKNSFFTDDQKARRLVDAVLLQVQLNSQFYQTFTEALKRAGDWTRAAVKELETSFNAH